ncbi:MAG: hypothetical protein RIQ70_1626, partial [Bacteroidota bacterium]
QWDVNTITPPVVTVNNDIICIGSTANLVGNSTISGGSYTWSTGDASQSINVNPLTTTIYTVTYDLNNCFQVSAQATVTVNQLLVTTFDQVGEICSGGTFTLPLISNEGITGTWTPAINNNTTTTYTFTPSIGQCAANAIMTVQVTPSITPLFNQVQPICSGNTLNTLPFTSNNGVTGTWSPQLDNLQTTTYTFTPDISPGPDCDQAANLCSSSTIYSVNNLNGGGNNDEEPEPNTCMDVVGPDEQNSAWFIWTAATSGNLTFDIIPSQANDDIDFILYEITGDNPCGDRTVLRCNSASCLNSTGSTGLSMSDTDVSEDPNCDPGENGYCQFITTIPGRTYALLVNNCNTNQGFNLQFNNGISNPAQFALPNSLSSYYNSTTCNGQCASITTMTIVVNQPSNIIIDSTICSSALPLVWNGISINSAGSYTANLLSNAGCDSVVTLNLSLITISATTTQTNVLCFGNATGSIDLTVSGGTAPYSSSWDNGSVTEDLSGLVAGTYGVIITDANGCSTSTSVTLTQPASGITATISNQVNVSCNGLSDGSLVINPSGGSGGYLISPSQNNLSAGNYVYTITDQSGCSSTLPVIITEPASLVAQLNNTVITTSGGTSVVTVTATGGTTPYIGTGSFTVLAGMYNYTVTDANGCTDQITVTITEPLPLIASSTAGMIQCNGGNSAVTVTASGGTAPYSGVGVFNEIAGTYSYTITDFYGNTSVTSITLTEPSILVASSTATSILCNGNQSTVTVGASGGVSPYTGTGLFNELAGVYNYTVTDMNGCTSSTSVTITQPAPLVVNDVIQNVMCSGGSGSVNITIAGGVAPYNVIWNGTTISEDLLSVTAGNYNGVITDANGCQTSITSIVQNDFAAQPTLTNITGTYQLTCAVTSINLQVNNAISYTWSGGLSAGSINNSFNSPDTY